MFPFKETKLEENRVIRTFEEDTDSDELIWHRDKEHRYVTVIEGKEWGLQLDDEMPVKIIPGQTYYIPKEKWHRVLKGYGNLVVEIIKLPELPERDKM